jgi:hypothetical protein
VRAIQRSPIEREEKKNKRCRDFMKAIYKTTENKKKTKKDKEKVQK